MPGSALSRRAYSVRTTANSWEEIWEAGPYFDRLSDLLEEAQSYAILVGWEIDSRLPLKGPNEFFLEPLKEKIIRICEEKVSFRFYFLLWDHAYFYVLERETWQGRIWEDVHPRVHFVFDNRHCLGGAHHEKLIIIDGKIALCGGVDLCGGRWDSPEHSYFDARRSLDQVRETHGPYHDFAVQVTGEICQQIQDHVARRWNGLCTIPFPSTRPHGSGPGSPVNQLNQPNQTVYLSRTLVRPSQHADRSFLVREVEFLFRDLIRTAQKRIILEGQYYWSRILNQLLIQKIKEMKGRDFEVHLILADLRRVKSLSRHIFSYELGLLRELREAARSSGIQLVIHFPSVFPPTGYKVLPPKPIYVHSKVVVIDDRYLSVGSANLATRAFRIDTEIQLTFEANSVAQRVQIGGVAQRILSHWRLFGNTLLLQKEEDLLVSHPILHSTRLGPEGPGARMLERGFPRFYDRAVEVLVDPVLPYFYRFKRKYERFTRKHWYSIIYLLILFWIYGAVFAWLLVGISWRPSLWPGCYLAMLSSVWMIPVPYCWMQVLIVFHLGYQEGVRVVVSALWIASFVGYWVARGFPASFFYYSNLTGPAWVPQRLGLRSFPVLLSILLDPRISIRSKIAYQGIYCVPLPWFLLGNGILLPALLYFLCRIEDWLLFLLIPQPSLALFKGFIPLLVILVYSIAVLSWGIELWKKRI